MAYQFWFDPTLCLLERNRSWEIQSLTVIHSSFLTPWVIEQRPPLGEHARRAGWVGCNIRLDRIPLDGEIKLIDGGTAFPREDIRRKFQRFLPLAGFSAEQRGWTTLTLKIARSLDSSTFSLSDLYAREREFTAVYPGIAMSGIKSGNSCKFCAILEFFPSREKGDIYCWTDVLAYKSSHLYGSISLPHLGHRSLQITGQLSVQWVPSSGQR